MYIPISESQIGNTDDGTKKRREIRQFWNSRNLE